MIWTRNVSTPLDREIRKQGAVAIIQCDDQWLMIRRSIHVRAPRKVCFPGGTIEPGESERDAVARELFEELGIVARPTHCAWRSVTSWGVGLCWWLVELPPGVKPTPNPQEVEEVLWISTQAALAHEDLLESAKEFFEAHLRGEVQCDHPSD